MAGRIRTIKPELLEDDKTAKLSHEGWRCFVSLILLADDYGNFRAHPALLDGAVFWGCGSVAGIGRLLRELGEASLVTLYEVRGQTYGHINGWSKHQRVDKPGKPRCPGPKEATNVLQYANSGILPESFRTDLRPPTSDLDLRPLPPKGVGAALQLQAPPMEIKLIPNRKAHRLPAGWKPSADLLSSLREKLGVDPMSCLDDFLDWAASSPKAVKLDWDATFRTWVRRAAKEGTAAPWEAPSLLSQRGTSVPQDDATPEQRAAAMANLAASLDDLERSAGLSSQLFPRPR